MTKKIPVAVVGATGYTGAELVRLLLAHPQCELVSLVGSSKAGQPIASVLPSLAGLVPGDVEVFDAAGIAARCQAAFTCLPHGASAKIVRELRAEGVPVFDLSADFRLRDLEAHAQWYGPHGAPELQPSAVYGLPELHREALRVADLVAVPGCFPTASILPLAPLLKAGLVDKGPFVVDAKTGVSGAGRSAGERTHFPETSESVRAYKIAGAHRHTVEIEQELSGAAGSEVRVIFTPHLIPMTRGILSSVYARAARGVDAARCTAVAREFFEGSPSVFVHEPGTCPDTIWVRGSNRAHISYAFDERSGFVLCQGAIDNLVKGAAGQALQCFNIRFGLEEGAGVSMPGPWP